MEALGVTQSSLILNKGRKYFGVKSEMPILGEPPCTRPVQPAPKAGVRWCERFSDRLLPIGSLLDC
ncbi:hypothetical protein MNBD_BACTEROID01-777, partial [hydrothermal vent metagenome]